MQKIVMLILLTTALHANTQDKQVAVQSRAIAAGKTLAGATVGVVGAVFGIGLLWYGITKPMKKIAMRTDGDAVEFPAGVSDLKHRKLKFKPTELIKFAIPAAFCFYGAKKGFEYCAQHLRSAISDK